MPQLRRALHCPQPERRPAATGSRLPVLRGLRLFVAGDVTRRDVSLLLLAAAVIFALLLIARGTPQATNTSAWREAIDVDYA